jgi:hypothetical protein
MRRTLWPGWRAAREVVGLAALVGCTSEGPAGGGAGGASVGPDGASGNGARTYELRDIGVSLNTTLGASNAEVLCRAVRARSARLWTQECLENLENTIRELGTSFTPRDDAEARISCASQDFYVYHCSESRDPVAAAAKCVAPYSPTCIGVTVRALDDCLADREAQLAKVPPCQKMTMAGQSNPTYPLPSCVAVFAACPDLVEWQ